MNADHADHQLADIAGAIADRARARMLCSLLDGHARTATELAALADIGSSTASGHFRRLCDQGLVVMSSQGKHRYFRLASAEVAAALEALLTAAGVARTAFQPTTPSPLRHARTCYDHCAGEVAVKLHDALLTQAWIAPGQDGYELTDLGRDALVALGIDMDGALGRRRRFAYPCLDWSERRPHLGGSLAAALLDLMISRDWVIKDLDSRALRFTAKGSRQCRRHFGFDILAGAGD